MSPKIIREELGDIAGQLGHAMVRGDAKCFQNALAQLADLVIDLIRTAGMAAVSDGSPG